MAYFNHAYKKVFLATAGDVSRPVDSAFIDPELTTDGNVDAVSGVLTSEHHISYLKLAQAGFGPGLTGFFGASDAAPGGKDVSAPLAIFGKECCPFYVASASIKADDKQGPFHGGYQESHKSKIVNPKYVRKMWGVKGTPAYRSVLQIGGTVDNIAANPACNKEFLCGETYYLRVEVKGTAALRFANHNLYQTLQADGGCCDDPTNPLPVSPEVIYLQYANAIVDNPYFKDFVRPLIEVTYDPGTGVVTETLAATSAIALAEGLDAEDTFDRLTNSANPNYIDPAFIQSVGLILVGAYVDTKFQDCTFQVSDYYGKEALQLFASEVDLNGDPCTFEGLCVTESCPGIQAEGLGETVIRELIQSEAYLQNFMHSDLRIREITQGTAVFDVIDRNALYGKFYILHSVPRFNNPTGVFDNDQYLLEIVTDNDGVDFLLNEGQILADQCVGCEVVPSYETSECLYDFKNEA
jgi:hypothetical protein